MSNPTVYLFANLPQTVQMFAGFANAIRELRPSSRIILIVTDHPRISEVTFDDLSADFAEVIRVGFCHYPAVRRIWLKDWQQIHRYNSSLQRIEFVPGSTLFLTCGPELVTNILLKRVKREAITTVWLRRHFVQNLHNLRFSYLHSAYYNLIISLCGAEPMDVFSLNLTGDGRAMVYPQYRRNPFAHTIYIAGQLQSRPLARDEMYRPYYFPRSARGGSRETVAVFGDTPWDSRPAAQRAFALRFNELLHLIRSKHAGARLVYRHHPGCPLDDRYELEGFDIETRVVAEGMLAREPSISTVYSIWSEATVHARFFGVRSFFLYHLFDDAAIPKSVKEHLDLYHEIYKLDPRITLESVEDWMNGKNDYPADFDRSAVLASVGVMLDELGI